MRSVHNLGFTTIRTQDLFIHPQAGFKGVEQGLKIPPRRTPASSLVHEQFGLRNRAGVREQFSLRNRGRFVCEQGMIADWIVN